MEQTEISESDTFVTLVANNRFECNHWKMIIALFLTKCPLDAAGPFCTCDSLTSFASNSTSIATFYKRASCGAFNLHDEHLFWGNFCQNQENRMTQYPIEHSEHNSVLVHFHLIFSYVLLPKTCKPCHWRSNTISHCLQIWFQILECLEMIQVNARLVEYFCRNETQN